MFPVTLGAIITNISCYKIRPKLRAQGLVTQLQDYRSSAVWKRCEDEPKVSPPLFGDVTSPAQNIDNTIQIPCVRITTPFGSEEENRNLLVLNHILVHVGLNNYVLK